MTLKRRLLCAVCLVAIGFAAARLWTWHRTDPSLNTPLHQGIGERIARETTQTLGHTGRVVVVKLPPGRSPELDAQWAAFRRALASSPTVEILAVDLVSADQKSKYGPGIGMSARRYLRLLEKYPHATALVSFLGAPDAQELPPRIDRAPRFVAYCRSPRELNPLLNRGILSAAIVPRFHFPAPGTNDPTTPAAWFERQCELVTPDMAVATVDSPGTAESAAP